MREVAICIKNGEVRDVRVGGESEVKIPADWKECDYIIHTHNFSERLSSADINASRILKKPICAVICDRGDNEMVCRYECVIPLREDINWAKVYTYEKIIGHLSALEEHFLSYPCWDDCIPKHILTLKIYLEEGIRFNIAPDTLQEILNFLDQLLYSKELSEMSDIEIVSKLREYRKRVWEDFKSYLSQYVPAAELNEFKCITKDEWKWEEKKPKTPSERYDVLEKCGAECFLDPTAKPPKFPICNKECCLDCDGLRAAYVRARALVGASKRAGKEELSRYYEEIAERARNLALKYGCLWVKEEEFFREEMMERKYNISFSVWEMELLKYLSKGGSLLFPEGKKYYELPEEQRRIIDMLIQEGLIRIKVDKTGWYMTDKGKTYFYRLRKKLRTLKDILAEIGIDTRKIDEILKKLDFELIARPWEKFYSYM